MEEEKKDNEYKIVTNDKKSNSKFKNFMIIVLVVFITFIVTTILVYNLTINNVISSALSSVLSSSSDNNSIDSKVAIYKKIIDKYYIGEVNEEKLIDGAVKGYVNALGDPYTEYISKDEMESYSQEIEGNYIGIGIYMVKNTKNNMITILACIKNSPAEKAGLQSGDYIIAVDGVEYTADQMTEASSKIKGEANTTVKLKINRDGNELEFEIKRENIKINPVEGKTLENNIGYIAFNSFDETTAEDFKIEYEKLKSSGIKSLIIDLRNNTGGIVEQAKQIAGYILPKDSVVLYEVDKDKNEKVIKTTTEPIIDKDIPIVVLVNGNSASSSEILVGALKDAGRVKVVGTTTYGKGVIQQLITLPNGTGMKVTCAEYLTPNKTKINEVGITPDEVVELPEGVNYSSTIKEEQDTQLKKAIELLK